MSERHSACRALKCAVNWRSRYELKQSEQSNWPHSNERESSGSKLSEVATALNGLVRTGPRHIENLHFGA